MAVVIIDDGYYPIRINRIKQIISVRSYYNASPGNLSASQGEKVPTLVQTLGSRSACADYRNSRGGSGWCSRCVPWTDDACMDGCGIRHRPLWRSCPCYVEAIGKNRSDETVIISRGGTPRNHSAHLRRGRAADRVSRLGQSTLHWWDR